MTDQLRDKFKKLRLAAEMKERDEALAVSAADKARRAEEAAHNAALDGAVKGFRDELPDAVALLAEVGIKAQVATDGATLLAGGKALGVRRVGLTIVIEENGRPSGMLEYKKPEAKEGKDSKEPPVLRYVDGRAFEGWPERLSRYMDAIVTETRKR